jgi:hypothetical protein
MKTNRWLGFAAVSVLLVGMATVWGTASPGQPPVPQPQQAPAWEYQFVETQYYVNDYEKAFNDMGKKGWEYCDIRQFRKVDDPEGQKVIRNATVIIFKRQVHSTAADRK